MTRHSPCKRQVGGGPILAVSILESDGEASDPPIRYCAPHHRHDGARVEPSGQERADRDVGYQLPLYRHGHAFGQLVSDGRSGPGITSSVIGYVVVGPEPADASTVDEHGRAG